MTITRQKGERYERHKVQYSEAAKRMNRVTLIGIVILCGGVASLAMFYSNPDNIGDKYSVKELKMKYPTVIDLNCGVENGELEYDKLPHAAKMALENFIQEDSILNIDCKKT